ncbi:hypothetical protein [Paenibacillus sp. 22594]|uniref:hypothetical protein n=1 Tax=Paenibacillus sp. 22594 TaxID=3453947 RepID=UPI003F86A995
MGIYDDNEYQDNNPEGLIFIRYRGARKGRPFNQHWLLIQLYELAMKKNITAENGNVFHFKTHQSTGEREQRITRRNENGLCSDLR